MSVDDTSNIGQFHFQYGFPGVSDLRLVNKCLKMTVVCIPEIILTAKVGVCRSEKLKIFRIVSSLNNYIREQLCP